MLFQKCSVPVLINVRLCHSSPIPEAKSSSVGSKSFILQLKTPLPSSAICESKKSSILKKLLDVIFIMHPLCPLYQNAVVRVLAFSSFCAPPEQACSFITKKDTCNRIVRSSFQLAATTRTGTPSPEDSTRSDKNSTSTEKDETTQLKPKSRLAQLAEDWLEEEEDELQTYWERFDENKNKIQSKEVQIKENEVKRLEGEEGDKDEFSTLTTEQRLERYFDRRGINKAKERKYAVQIKEAITTAQNAKTPEAAIEALDGVRAWLQVNTSLGGMALYELAVALWQRDGVPDEALLQELLGNSYMRAKVQKLLRDDKPPDRQDADKSLWQGLLDPSKWWT